MPRCHADRFPDCLSGDAVRDGCHYGRGIEPLNQRFLLSNGTRLTNFENGSPFMTVTEVALLLRVSTMTIYRLVKAGELPAVRIGRSYRLRPEDIDKYLSQSMGNGDSVL